MLTPQWETTNTIGTVPVARKLTAVDTDKKLKAITVDREAIESKSFYCVGNFFRLDSFKTYDTLLATDGA